jgi:alpha-tubulin suppressor-like RCC1 family protein
MAIRFLTPAPPTSCHILFIAMVKIKKGAYGRKIRTDNAPDVACDATTKDGENCDQDVVFRDSEVKDSAAAASFYYDKVKWQAKTVFEDGMHGVLAVTQVSVGYRNTCAIDSSGALHCWGDNSRGQLGNGSTTSSTQPVKVIGKWQMVKTGVTTCALDMSEMLWCWGSNVFGQVGDGTTSHRSTPVQVSSTLSWKTFSGPDVSGTVCGIKSDDSLWCWGDNGYGQLGDGSTVRKKVPTAVSGGGSWKFVTVWGESTCGIKNDDSLWCWGRNDYGQLGDGTSTSKSVPTAISGGGLWQDVTLVFRNACGIKIDKSLWCWGYNKHGAVGDGMSVTRQTTPVEVVGGGLWDELAITTTDCSTMYFVSIYNRDALADSDGWSYGCGASWGWSVYPEVCGKKVDGTLWCWGYMAGVDVFTPTEISGGGVWSDVIASNGSLCAVKLSDDMLRCWGNNNVGQLGNQTTVDQALPVSVQSGNVLQSSRMGVVGVVCGISGNDNSLWCWGVNASGQVGDGTTTNRSVPTMVELR